ncbi:MAG: hypothetical protein Q4C60_08685 [Eubacteriales bacterium]|nr:hypothetical protein [Eubacteriales bacterium]
MSDNWNEQQTGQNGNGAQQSSAQGQETYTGDVIDKDGRPADGGSQSYQDSAQSGQSAQDAYRNAQNAYQNAQRAQGGYQQGAPNSQPANSKSIAALVLGIVSCVFILFGYGAIIGIICGVIGLIMGIDARKTNKADNLAMLGIIFSSIGLGLCALVFLACVACVGVIGLLGMPFYW